MRHFGVCSNHVRPWKRALNIFKSCLLNETTPTSLVNVSPGEFTMDE